MRVIFFGTSEFAVDSLEALVARRHRLDLCVTQPDRPQGRGLEVVFSPVKQAAQRLGVPLLQPERLHAALFASLRFDVGVVVAYGKLLRQEVLSLPRHGMLGVHPSLLPKYRGAAPIAWSLLNGETATGVTIFRLSEALDAGDILSQQMVTIEPGENAEMLGRRLARVGAEALIGALDDLDAGRANFTPQDETRASFAPKLTKATGRIDWNSPAAVIERLVRGTIPWPGAGSRLGEQELRIWKVAFGDGAEVQAETLPGTVVRVGSNSLTVATGQGTIEIQELQPAGRRRMSVRDYVAGHPVRVGERFAGERQQKSSTEDCR